MIRIDEGSPAHWVIRLLWAAATIVLVLYIPTQTETATINDVTVAIQLAIAALSLNLVLGYTGIISIGHSAFFGVGMYTTGILVDRHGWSQGWTVPVAAGLAFVVGALVSVPALRLKGLYLAIVTLAIAVLFPTLVKWDKLAWLTHGPSGINGVSYDDVPSWPLLGDLRGRDGRAVFIYWLGILLLSISYLVCRGIVKSRVGRALIAIRDNNTAAAVMGIHRARTTTVVFGISAAMCSLAGSLSAIAGNLASPDIRFVTLTGGVTFLLIMILGGAATLWGPIVGAVVYVLVETRVRDAGTAGDGWINTVFHEWLNFTTSPATFILAVALLAVVFVAPFGIVGLLKRTASRFVVIVPRPAGSLVEIPVPLAAASDDAAAANTGRGVPSSSPDQIIR